MSDLPGPLKELALNLPWKASEASPEVPKLSHIPLPKEIKAKHKWIAGAVASGFKYKEVAAMFDVSEGYVAQIANWRHPALEVVRIEARKRMAEQVEDLSSRIAFHAEEALERTVEIMRQQTSISDARMAAKDIMDRAGYAPVKKVAQVSAQVPSDEFVQAVERMSASDEVRSRQSEWAWSPPTSANSAQEGE